jgi:hypothetical protein
MAIVLGISNPLCAFRQDTTPIVSRQKQPYSASEPFRIGIALDGVMMLIGRGAWGKEHDEHREVVADTPSPAIVCLSMGLIGLEMFRRKFGAQLNA